MKFKEKMRIPVWLKNLWPLIPKEEFFKILFSALFAFSAGWFLNCVFQKATFEREARFELVKTEINESKSTVFEVMSLVDQRLFLTQKVIWVIESGDKNNVTKEWNEYMDVINKWNENDLVLQARLNQAFGYEVGGQFLSGSEDKRQKIPTSIHYKFYKIHEKILDLKNCLYSSCNNEEGIRNRIDLLMEELNKQQSILFANLNSALIKKQNNLRKSPTIF
jgi:hypothetical protein